MEDFSIGEKLLMIFAILVCLLIIFSPLINDILYKTYYEYIDLDNNKGIAKECQYTDKSIKSGGQGTPICELKDGTIIMVKQYKHIIERK